MVLGAALALAACSSAGGSDDTSEPTGATPATVQEGPVAATAVVAGDCLTDVVVGAAEQAEVSSARKVSCHAEHTLEVYATFDLHAEDFDQTTGAEYPGTPRVVRAADRGCMERFDDLTDEADRYGLLALWPSQTSWDTGDRTVACAVFSATGELFEAPQFA